MTFEYADRIKRLPPYLFAEIEKTIKEKKAQGIDLISDRQCRVGTRNASTLTYSRTKLWLF